jgi:alpha-N-arabinofuranosidase
MANIAQMVNVLQAMVLTDKEKMVLTPTYHVFRMYRVHQGATKVPIELNAPEYKLNDVAVPSLNASASRDGEGRLHLSIVNLDPNRSSEIIVALSGGSVRSVTGEVLTATAMNAMNSFNAPNTVKAVPFSAFNLSGSQLSVNIPSKAVVMLELK